MTLLNMRASIKVQNETTSVRVNAVEKAVWTRINRLIRKLKLLTNSHYFCSGTHFYWHEIETYHADLLCR